MGSLELQRGVGPGSENLPALKEAGSEDVFSSYGEGLWLGQVYRRLMFRIHSTSVQGRKVLITN